MLWVGDPQRSRCRVNAGLNDFIPSGCNWNFISRLPSGSTKTFCSLIVFGNFNFHGLRFLGSRRRFRLRREIALARQVSATSLSKAKLLQLLRQVRCAGNGGFASRPPAVCHVIAQNRQRAQPIRTNVLRSCRARKCLLMFVGVTGETTELIYRIPNTAIRLTFRFVKIFHEQLVHLGQIPQGMQLRFLPPMRLGNAFQGLQIPFSRAAMPNYSLEKCYRNS